VIHFCKTFLEKTARQWNLPAEGGWDCLVYNQYYRSNVNLLWFHAGGRYPRAITKLSQRKAVLEREFENLGQAYACVPTRVPRPLYFGEQQGMWSLWMTAVPGWRVPPRRTYSTSTLRSLVDVLVSIHGSVRKAGASSDDERFARMVSGPLRMLAQFGPSEAVRAGCAQLEKTISAEWLRALPVIPQHGDLFSDHVLLDGTQGYVVDWESYGAIDLPFYDLFTLLLSVLRVGGETPEKWNPEMARQIPVLLLQYARALDLRTSCLRELMPLMLANWLHLQWTNERPQLSTKIYGTIQHFFDHPGLWQPVWMPA